MAKSYEEINEKIKKGRAVVLTAEEMTELVKSEGAGEAAGKVDVVTTGTFGPMCSSGAFVNFGHSDPPIKMHRLWLNDVPVCADVAAVDAYIGAAAISDSEGLAYGGGHIIQDLIEGKRIKLKSTAIATDCYPRKEIETEVALSDLNQAYLFNPRNAYENYASATNSSEKTIYTYMGILLPNYGNITYCSAGQLNPLLNDPDYRTIGIGTRIFLGGGTGYVAWAGTQHNPEVERNDNGVPVGPSGSLALIGDMKTMDSKFIRGARFHRYGVTLYVGIGIPIPILDEDMAVRTGISDEDIETYIFDYSEPSRARNRLKKVNYRELRSGKVELKGRMVKTAPLSSFKMSREIAGILKQRILEGAFTVSRPVEELPRDGGLNTLEERRGER
ncbi:MAG: homocysteine biosynthesis protein [Actinobacteria bacterium]|nr:homocysteine biosynthesis protein [Actinomycetota bacterium]